MTGINKKKKKQEENVQESEENVQQIFLLLLLLQEKAVTTLWIYKAYNPVTSLHTFFFQPSDPFLVLDSCNGKGRS